MPKSRATYHRQRADQRRMAGLGVHGVHVLYGRREPTCAECAPPTEPEPGAPPAGLTASWAERHQPEVTATDHQLAELARLSHPAVRWWWGERRDGMSNGAYCYLCERFVATWDHRWPMPVRAGQELITHRDRAHVPGAPF